jgi:hypothetical protein
VIVRASVAALTKLIVVVAVFPPAVAVTVVVAGDFHP